MNTEEIDRILRRQCARDFDGVFSVHTLPDRPRLLVCNTDPSYRPGRHWVAICMKDGRGEYFDSFGRRPSAEFERYMNNIVDIGLLTINSCRVSSVNFVDIIVFAIVCIVVVVSIRERLCVVLLVTLL